MIEALLIATLATLLAFLSRFKNLRFLFPLSFIIITIFLSLGYEWGNDVHEYEYFFKQYTESGYGLFDFSSYSDLSVKSEFGWVLINQLCEPLGFYGMRAVLFCIENYIIYRFISRNVTPKWLWLAVFVYTFNTDFMVLSSSMMRQWLSMCIIILGTEFIEKKKWLIYVLLVLIASSIHRSALICLPLVFLPKLFKYELKSQALVLFIPVFFIYFIFSGFLVDYMSIFLRQEDAYTNYMSASDSTGLGIVNFIKLGVYLLVFRGCFSADKSKRLYMVIPLLFCLILPFYSVSAMSSRLTFYFTVFTICSFPLYLQRKNVSSFSSLFMTLSCMVLALYNLYVFVTNPMWMLNYGKFTTLFEAGILK